jgi:hypothetical protein
MLVYVDQVHYELDLCSSNHHAVSLALPYTHQAAGCGPQMHKPTAFVFVSHAYTHAA